MATMTGLSIEVSPEEVGPDRAGLAHLDRHLDSHVAHRRQPGSPVVITRGGRVAHVCRLVYQALVD